MLDIGCDNDRVTKQDQFSLTESPSGSMLFWADRLLQIKQEIADTNIELERLKHLFDNAEKTLFDMMSNNQVDQFKRNGYSFSPSIKTRASIKAELKNEAMEWLKMSDFQDIVKETVHAQTLTSMVKEWQENGISPDIEPFFEMLNIYHEQEISIRKGR